MNPISSYSKYRPCGCLLVISRIHNTVHTDAQYNHSNGKLLAHSENDTVLADAKYRLYGCKLPYLRMQDTVQADADYRINGCALPYQRMQNLIQKQTEDICRYALPSLVKNSPNLFLIFSNQIDSYFRNRFIVARSQVFRNLVCNTKKISQIYTERLSGRLLAVQSFGRNYFSRKFWKIFLCEQITEQFSMMRPYKPHPVDVFRRNLHTSRCRNSGQIKVASQRATHLNLSPRCDGLADKSSLSSYIDALVPAALRSDVSIEGGLASNTNHLKIDALQSWTALFISEEI